MEIDLHQHSIYSDGSEDPIKIIRKNIKKHIKIMALTDHDTIEGCCNVVKKFKNKKITFINGIEFSTKDEDGNVHLLAYGYDLNNKALNELIKEIHESRLKRIDYRLQHLKEDFNIILPDKFLKQISSSSNPNKVLIANILIKLGYANTIQEAISKYLYHKLPDLKISTSKVVKVLSEEKIVTCLAHPLGGVGEKRVPIEIVEKRIAFLKTCGLNALECFYSLYNYQEIEMIKKLADKYDLLLSAGSDYHGKNKAVKIGETSAENYNFSVKNVTILKALLKSD